MRHAAGLAILVLSSFPACKGGGDSATESATTVAAAGATTLPGGSTTAAPVTTLVQQAGTLAVNALATAYPEGFALSALPSKVPAELPVSLASVGTLAVQAALVDQPLPPLGNQPQGDPPLGNQPQGNQPQGDPPLGNQPQGDPPLGNQPLPPLGNGAAAGAANGDSYDPAAQTVSDKLTDAAAKLRGEGDCLTAGLLNARTFDIHSIRCYDPDGDLDNSVNGSSPGSKLDGSDEACMAGYGRATMASTIGVVDSATGLVLAMLCEAKKTGKAAALPEISATLDLKDALQGALPHDASVGTATITRLADQASGRPVYRTDVTVTSNQRTVEVHLLHSPSQTEGNAEANGRLWIKRLGDANGAQYIEVAYDRSGTATEPRLRYRLTEGLFKTTGSGPAATLVIGEDPFDANGNLDLNKGEKGDHSFPSDTPQDHNTALSSQQFIAFDVNPLTNTGKLMFWKNFGGNYEEAARGMVFNLDRGDGNGVAGCSVSGATGGANGAFSVRKAQKEGFTNLTPRGFYHPQGTPQFADLVYKQCFRQDADGKYLIDDAATQDDAKGFDVIPFGKAEVTLPDLNLPELSL